MKPTIDAFNLFLEGSIALAAVESTGMRIDEAYLDQAITDVSAKIDRRQKRLRSDKTFDLWRKTFGAKTNLGSRVQLAEIIFGKLGYKPAGQTDSGRDRTDKRSLESVDLPFVKTLLELESLKKLRAVSLEGLKREMVDGLLHPDLHLHTVKSYRGSSGGGAGEGDGGSYNSQNIPARDLKQAEIVRKAFIPRPGRVLIENDFAAHEFKLGAIVWDDPEMLRYASDKSKDIHRDMAMRCFLLEKEDVSKDSRYVGKNGFVFPKMYGSYWKSIARAMWSEIDNRKLVRARDGVGLHEHLAAKGIRELGDADPREGPRPGTFEAHIKTVEEWFLKKFHVFAERTERAWQDYRATGCWQMKTGFVVRGLYTKNARLNYDVQGPAFHCLLWALTRLVMKELRRHKMKARVVNSVHDCIISDVPEREVQNYINLVREIVEVKLPKAWRWLAISLEVECEVCPENWFGKTAWVELDGEWGPKS